MELIISFLWISLILWFLYLAKHKLNPRAGKTAALPLPPGPTPLPIIGNMLDMGAQPHRSLARLARIYGPVMSLRVGLTTTVVVSSPAAAREVLQKKDLALSARPVPDTFHALGHHETSIILLPSGNPLRKNLRAIIAAHIFSHSSLDATLAVRERQVRELVAYLRRHTGQPVKLLFWYSTRCSTCYPTSSSRRTWWTSHRPKKHLTKNSSVSSRASSRRWERRTSPTSFPFSDGLTYKAGVVSRQATLEGRFYKFFGNIFDRRLAEINSGAENN